MAQERAIFLNIESKEIRCAKVKHGKLDDLIVERKRERQLTGNIYKGLVKNILHNIQSAFIDINEDDNGFIHISDIIENTKKFEQIYEMDFDLDYDIQKVDESSAKKMNIEQVMKPDQFVLVQVVKEPIGSKGARLTSNISIAGRYLVLLPNSSHRGVSRKIEDVGERDRLKKLVRAFEMPQDMGLICRTASSNVANDLLIEEARELFENWERIMKNFQKAQKPTLLYAESDLIKRALIASIDEKYERLVIDHYPTYQICKKLYSKFASEHPLKIEYYRDHMPMFERFHIEKDIEKSLRHKTWLPSGGYLFFDRTEAMHTVDVNSGRSSGNKRDVEESLVRINMEAAEEIARQLRLRNVGGLVICDFIDMRLKKNQRRVLDRLKECMKGDHAKCSILGMSEFGLVEMTRQRHRGSLAQTFFTNCPYCTGTGLIKSHESVTIEIERALKKLVLLFEHCALRLDVHPELHAYIKKVDKNFLQKMAREMNASVEFASNENMHVNDYHFYSSVTNKRIEL